MWYLKIRVSLLDLTNLAYLGPQGKDIKDELGEILEHHTK